MKEIILISFLAFVSLATWAQTDSTLVKADSTIQRMSINGQVRSMSDSLPIPYVHLIKMYERKGAITDSLGRFRTTVYLTDSIRFTAIGYIPIILPIPDPKTIPTGELTVFMNDTIYPLSDINIALWRWLDLQYKMAQDMPTVEYEITDRVDEFINETEIAQIVQSTSVPGIFLPMRSKYDRQRELVAKLEKEAMLKNQSEKNIRYYSEKITGLHYIELESFIQYMGLSDAEILGLREYDLIILIRNKFKYYRKQQESTNK